MIRPPTRAIIFICLLDHAYEVLLANMGEVWNPTSCQGNVTVKVKPFVLLRATLQYCYFEWRFAPSKFCDSNFNLLHAMTANILRNSWRDCLQTLSYRKFCEVN